VAKLRSVSSAEIVLEILRAIAAPAIMQGREHVVFTKAQFIKAYWALRRQDRVPAVKIETLLRMLRKFAAESEFLRYGRGRGGVYLLDTVRLPL